MPYTRLTILLFVQIASVSGKAQDSLLIRAKQILKFYASGTDTLTASNLRQKLDSNSRTFYRKIKQQLKTLQAKGEKQRFKHIDSVFTLPFKTLFKPKPFFIINGGMFTYNLNYRSNPDTPFIEKNILQHNSYGNINFAAAGLPLRMNFIIRKSNSALFRDINDVQVIFDAQVFRANWQKGLKQHLLSYAEGMKDSLLEINYQFHLKKFADLQNWFNTPSFTQKLAEYKEILAIPELNFQPGLSDSINRHRADSAKAIATEFLNLYYSRKKTLDSIRTVTDSLRQAYTKMLDRIQAFREIIQRPQGILDIQNLEKELKKRGIKEKLIPSKYKWLLNVRRFGAGRNLLNYSELTSKNISLKGIDFEYNSKRFYWAVSAGAVDYRYRDFIAPQGIKSKQYLLMLRAGTGTAEGNHFFVTLYKGKKQPYFTSFSNNQRLLAVTGIAAELKYQVNKNIYVVAEAAESLSPDLRTNPETYSKFDFTDKKNKAVSAKLSSYFPKTNTKVSASYKYTGANFQSFSTFQSSSAVKSWNIKFDQSFFKRAVKITASIRTNDFSNPYIPQQYNSNTVFKSLQLTVRKKHFPSLGIGYMPVSQLTKMDNQVIENVFNSLNIHATHFYKLFDAPASTVLMYNRFYNKNTDTAFVYYNATNIFWNQTVSYSFYTLTWAASHSSSKDYELNILDGGIVCKIKKAGSAGFGFKVNNFNRTVTKTSMYTNVQLNLKKWGMLGIVYDNGYIPSAGKTFVKNKIFNLLFTQAF